MTLRNIGYFIVNDLNTYDESCIVWLKNPCTINTNETL